MLFGLKRIAPGRESALRRGLEDPTPISAPTGLKADIGHAPGEIPGERGEPRAYTPPARITTCTFTSFPESWIR